MTTHHPLVLTMGEPAGIGGEITLKTWANKKQNRVPPFFIIDDPSRLRGLGRRLKIDIPIKEIRSPEAAEKTFDEALPVLALPMEVKTKPGNPTTDTAKAVISSIETAVKLVQDGRAGGVVTNPIAKAVLNDAGFQFPGHTEFLAHLAEIKDPPVMMLASPELRVVLATIHVSLKNSVEQLSKEKIIHVGKICFNALRDDFAIAKPRIAVAGLNPHAGEEGSMGDEEIEIIIPAIKALQDEGIDAFGPYPPDTMFTPSARKEYDAALCMYHDQGLIPLKTLGIEKGVNITLGLPFVRTSPDHGTAFDIAGSGNASEDSLVAALKTASAMCIARNEKSNK